MKQCEFFDCGKPAKVYRCEYQGPPPFGKPGQISEVTFCDHHRAELNNKNWWKIQEVKK